MSDFAICMCLLGIKSADRNELAQISSQPSSDFTSFVGDFKLLNTLLPLVSPQVCSKAGGVYASDGMWVKLNNISILKYTQSQIYVWLLSQTLLSDGAWSFLLCVSPCFHPLLSSQRLFLVRPTFSSQARRMILSGFAGVQQGGLWVVMWSSTCHSLAWVSLLQQNCVRWVQVFKKYSWHVEMSIGTTQVEVAYWSFMSQSQSCFARETRAFRLSINMSNGWIFFM